MSPKRFDGARLRQARGEKQIEAVALAAGVSTQTVRRWETGETEPDASKLALVAAFLGIPMDALFSEAA